MKLPCLQRLPQGSRTAGRCDKFPMRNQRKANPALPYPLNWVTHRLANLSQVIFRPRNRTVKDLSRQMFRTFKPRAQIIEAGRKSAPCLPDHDIEIT